MFAIQKGRSKPVRISSKRCGNDKVAPVMVRDTVFARAGGEGKMPSLQPAGCRRYIAMRLRNSSAERLATRMTLFLLLWPEAMVTEDRGTFKSLAKNSMHASLARPSMGGEVRETLSATPTSPVMAFFFARG